MTRVRQSPAFVALTVVSVYLFATAYAHSLSRSLHAGRESYGITEWLINYSGGFVRRGWPGELLAWVSSATAWQANYIVLSLSAALLGVLVLVFMVRGRGRIPLILLVSPVLLGMPLYTNFMIRKDVFGVLLLALCLLIRRSVQVLPVRMSALNLVAVLAILSHETFFFYAVPALIVLTLQDMGGGLRRLPVATALLAPAFLAFVLSTVFKGDAALAQTIHDSWGGLWRSIDPSDCCLSEPGGSIEGLRWTSEQALSLPYSVLSAFSHGIYVPLAWVLTLAACFMLLTLLIMPRRPGDRGRLACILLFQLLMIAPLFVVGWDFGRWIFFWTCSSVLLHMEDVSLSERVSAALSRRLAWMAVLSPRGRLLLHVCCLFLAIPGCCWDAARYFGTTPVGHFLGSAAVRQLLERAF